MLTRSGHFRTFVALLLAVMVPFCCCNFHSWVSACASCVPASPVDGDRQLAAKEHDHKGCHHSGSKGSDSGGDHHQGPVSPEDDSDQHDCTCGKNQVKMMAGEKPTIELPTTVLVAILNWTTVAWAAPEPSITFVSGEVWACARPPTSLLRMHCALIV
ncbi:MAG: hypothetical protein RL580_913 [Pseudomonadota bacterium]|jgi:hypothetical protein|nr:hypothetical protein [Phycisphaerales bacterium]